MQGLGVADTGWPEFGLAGLPRTGGGQECVGAEHGRRGQILDPSESWESGAEDQVMAHTSGGSTLKKQLWGFPLM